MTRPRLVCKPTPTVTRFLLTHDRRELLRATLPPTTYARWQAAPTLCEALSLWLQQPLSIVLAVDDPAHGSALGLCDALGFGLQTIHYDVEVRESVRHPLGSFRDLRQLDLGGVR